MKIYQWKTGGNNDGYERASAALRQSTQNSLASGEQTDYGFSNFAMIIPETTATYMSAAAIK